jgi:signal recognition particle subunit SRP54
MLDALTERLSSVVKTLRGHSRLTEENVQEMLREVRLALLDADAGLPVVKDFVAKVKEEALGQEVVGSLTPGQALVGVVHHQLVELMGGANAALNFATTPPAIILLAGLQGSGKTTSTAKLARFLKERRQKRAMVVSCDVYRPAAIDQLQRLAEEIGVACHPSSASEDPVAIARGALEAARRQAVDVLLVDTAGRLHVDGEMMAEIRHLHEALQPTETLFVVDAMTGQDAATTARAFHEALPLTGVILTKTDGDARGGAALSIRRVTGKPIKFLGVGERTAALEPFYPDRIASRILGMGDVLSLVEEVERKVDREKAQQLADKVATGKRFDLSDFRDQIDQMLSMGGLGGLLDKLPGASGIPEAMKSQVNDGELRRLVAIINSMTLQERQYPDIIKGSRKRRIAAGAGVQIQDVNRLLKQFSQTQKMMKKMKKGGMAKLMRGLRGRLPSGGLGGGFGGGNPPFH